MQKPSNDSDHCFQQKDSKPTKSESCGKAKKVKISKALCIAFSGVAVCAVAVVTLIILYSGLRVRYYVELGDALPPASAFSSNNTITVSYITDAASIDVASTGSRWIHISANGKNRLVNLVIRDTVAPQAQPVETSISIAQELTPDQLVSDLKDADSVKLQWDEAPDFGTVGDYPVMIRMTDMSGNAATVTSLVHIRAVEATVTCEAGSALPALASFLVDDSLSAAFVTDVDAIPLDTPGEYAVDIAINGITYTSQLIVVDTVMPEVSLRTVYLEPGASAAPEDFVASYSDASSLSYEFVSEPDYSIIGAQNIQIRITDLGGNAVSAEAMLLISNVAPITIEARENPVTVDDFDVSGYASASLTTELIPNTLGEHLVDLFLDGVLNPSIVTVVDTTPPYAQSANVFWYLDHPLTADKLVADAYDCTGTTCTYVAEPDWAQSEAQLISVVVTDAAGNTTEVTSTLTLQPDTEAPSLYGVMDRYCYIGQAVAYFAEVFAEDNCDEEVTIDVDKSQVNIYAAGTYPVSYTATDSSGNSVTLSCEFTFIEETITDEQLNAVADEVLAEITTSDMSIGYKAYAIYKYVFTHIRYNGVSNKTDWKYEAYRGITEGRGDCFTFYATAKCLLERIGAQTMCVERHGGNRTTHHYWLLVNLGTGWYHFDAINVGPRNYECFMRTDAELHARGANFWSFDRSLYPPTPTESYVLE